MNDKVICNHGKRAKRRISKIMKEFSKSSKIFLIEYKIIELDFPPVNRKEFIIAENEDSARERFFKKFEDMADTYGFSIEIESVKEVQ